MQGAVDRSVGRGDPNGGLAVSMATRSPLLASAIHAMDVHFQGDFAERIETGQAQHMTTARPFEAGHPRLVTDAAGRGILEMLEEKR
jgi:hypothetical protein